MTPGATATTTDRKACHVEYDAYVSSTPATTTAPAQRRSMPVETSPLPVAELPSLVPLGEALRPLVGLQRNWDSYDALPPSKASLDYAWSVGSALVDVGLPVPQVFPTATGGVQLEWHSERVSLEWEIDASAASGVFAFDDVVTGERLDGELPQDIELLVETLGRVLAE
jgi:hypothetical protein